MKPTKGTIMSNELHDAKRLERIVNDIAKFKSDTLFSVSEKDH